MNATRNILLLTHSLDVYTIDKVFTALTDQGANPIRLDTDLFPDRIHLSSCFEDKGGAYILDWQGREITLDSVEAVWLRKLGSAKLDENLDPNYRQICMNESYAALAGFLDGLSGAFWMDPLQSVESAEDKIRQLRLAWQANLAIPKTLITNSPVKAKVFFEALEGNVVGKLLRPTAVSMSAADGFMYTSKIREDDLRNLQSLKFCPMVFQEYVPVDRELRVVYVAGQFFCGEIVIEKNTSGQPDWRRKDNQGFWKRREIPIALSRQISEFMGLIGLNFGAMDFIRRPDGKYIFLEVNPCGEWGMLERDLGLPISQAIADTLLSNSN
jgi:glutathione synthase/RimK-type ligase-like ATP-grasp enzyme